MSIEKNGYYRLFEFMNATQAPNKHWRRAEAVLTITTLFSLIVGALALSQLSIFAQYSSVVGFSCLATAAVFPLIKTALCILNCCREPIVQRASFGFRCQQPNIQFTDDQVRSAVPYVPRT